MITPTFIKHYIVLVLIGAMTLQSLVASAQTPPGSATLMSPVNFSSTTERKPSLRWGHVTDASWYYLYAVDSAGEVRSGWHSADTIGCGTGTCGVRPENDLGLGNVQWWVLSWGNGVYGAWSNEGGFTIIEAPTMTGTNGNTANNGSGYPARDEDLCKLVNDYREANGLTRVPLSRALMVTARAHVEDSRTYVAPVVADPLKSCNLHSWGASQPPAQACCYTKDHKNPGCMWDKPKQLTAGWSGTLSPFTANGFENSAKGQTNNADALQSWKNSTLPNHHRDVILNRGIWNTPWKGIGCGSDETNRNFHLWFTQQTDPNPAPGG